MPNDRSVEKSENEVIQRMNGLEEKYNILREEVDEQLEVAWGNAGLIPKSLSQFLESGKNNTRKERSLDR